MTSLGTRLEDNQISDSSISKQSRFSLRYFIKSWVCCRSAEKSKLPLGDKYTIRGNRMILSETQKAPERNSIEPKNSLDAYDNHEAEYQKENLKFSINVMPAQSNNYSSTNIENQYRQNEHQFKSAHPVNEKLLNNNDIKNVQRGENIDEGTMTNMGRRHSNPLPMMQPRKELPLLHVSPPPKRILKPKHFTFDKSEILNSYLTSHAWPEMINRVNSEVITTFAAITRIPSPKKISPPLKEINDNNNFNFTYHNDDDLTIHPSLKCPEMMIDIPIA